MDENTKDLLKRQRAQINKEKLETIAERISTPEGRITLEAHMWNPMPRGKDVRMSSETELEWAQRVMGNFRSKVNERNEEERNEEKRKIQ